ncbi:MAG: hypothetical protein QXL82_00255 [Candidatus Aenigmatarchaeota archaeon]
MSPLSNFFINFQHAIKELEKFYPIRGKREKLAANFIMSFLEEKGISYEIQKFKNQVPNGKSKLICDGVEIKSLPSSFVSGKIRDKNLIPNILIRENFSEPNIAFNPYSKAISLATFYYVASLTISRNDVQKVLKADEIYGKVKIKKEKFTGYNIIVGNIKTSKRLIFAHYDTVLNGAIDNSSGTAFLLSLITNSKYLKEENLFLICGSEELSFEKPYWGYGYRIFEKEFEYLFKEVKEIIVVDCIGFDKPIFIDSDKNLKMEAFPIKNFEKYEKKIVVFSSISENNIKDFYSFYHSYLDTKKLLEKKYIEESFEKFLERIRK